MVALQGWSELAGSGSGAGLSATPDTFSNLPRLAIDAQGRPTVSWLERIDNINHLHLRQWNGGAWIELGGSATGLGVSATPLGVFGTSLALDAQGRPTLTWSSAGADSTMDIHLRRWNGSAWTGC